MAPVEPSEVPANEQPAEFFRYSAESVEPKNTVLRTPGIGVTVGRERFSGPPGGAGSQLVTDGPVGRGWEAQPAQLDGGAGSAVVTLVGTSCEEAGAPPSSLPLRVVTADRVVHPFVAPIDATLLRQAFAQACPSR